MYRTTKLGDKLFGTFCDTLGPVWEGAGAAVCGGDQGLQKVCQVHHGVCPQGKIE